MNLNLFRKRETPRAPLHARWGDVAITVPTDGSWCQFDNPHHRHHHYKQGGGRGRQQKKKGSYYGPGFVPDCSEDDDYSSFSEDDTEEEGDDFDDEAVLTKNDYEHMATAASAAKRRSSFSIPILKPRRRFFSTRSTSASVSSRRTSHVATATSASDKESHRGSSSGGFVYKPVDPQDYTEEVEKRVSGYYQNNPSISSIPTSEKYLEEEFVTTIRPKTKKNATGTSRNHFAKPSIDSGFYTQSQGRWDFVDGGDEEKDLERGRSSSRSNRQMQLEIEKKPWKLLPLASNHEKQTSLTRNGSIYGKKNKNNKTEKEKTNSNKKKNRISRAATVTMVSDPEDLYG
ncbi:hypothetical protein VTN00DRAFT_819 [Thermoascus crustaceus]|uniref:uncharacterized protein n=1 Tax=Thermoascus crustaceus TaxID=5088 RepID=UPI0037445B28